MSKDLNSLYTAVSNANFDIGSFEEFSVKMQTPEQRKRFYDAMAAQNVDLGDYNEYESKLKPLEDFADEREPEVTTPEVKEDLSPEDTTVKEGDMVSSGAEDSTVLLDRLESGNYDYELYEKAVEKKGEKETDLPKSESFFKDPIPTATDVSSVEQAETVTIEDPNIVYTYRTEGTKGVPGYKAGWGKSTDSGKTYEPVDVSDVPQRYIEQQLDQEMPEDKGFLEDILIAARQGEAAGGSVDEAFDVYKKGADISDEQLQDFIDAANAMEAIGPTNEQVAFQRTSKDAGGGIWGTMVGLAENPGFFPQMLVTSVVTMGRSLGSDEVIGATVTGAGAGAAVGATGLSFGPLGVFTTGGGAATGAMTGLIGAMETGLTLTELLKDELDGAEFNKENVRAILNDKDAIERITANSLKRGLTIGAVEGLTLGLSRGIGGQMVKAARETGKTGVGAGLKVSTTATGIEGTGGFTGEVLGQIASGKEVDLGEAALEAAGELKGVVNVSDIVVNAFRKSEYSINGEKRTKEEIRNIVNSPNTTAENLAKINLEVKGDNEFNDFVKEKQNDAILETQINAKVEDLADRKKLVDLEKQRAKAEADTKKKGIQSVPGAKQTLEGIEIQINEIIGKYTAIDLSLIHI